MQAYTVEQVAEMLHIGRDKVYGLLRTGQLRSMKIGKLRRITDRHLAEFVASLEHRPMAATTTATSARRGRTKTNPPLHMEGGTRMKVIIGKYEATIYPEGDGYTGAISLGFDAAGTRRRVKRKGRTKAQVRDKLREVVEDLEAGSPRPRGTRSLTPSATSWTRA